MTENVHKKWIVLIQKRPRGPLSEQEVNTLLNQGIIRTTDTAIEVTEQDNEKNSSAWKLLWQFPEFDRRKKRAEQAAKDAAKLEAERRQQLTATQLENQVREAIPEELLKIAPEELVLGSKQSGEFDESVQPPPLPLPTGMMPSRTSSWIYISTGGIVILLAAYLMKESGTITKEKIASQLPSLEIPKIDPDVPMRAPTARPHSEHRTPSSKNYVSPAPKVEEIPRPNPDRGEVQARDRNERDYGEPPDEVTEEELEPLPPDEQISVRPRTRGKLKRIAPIEVDENGDADRNPSISDDEDIE